MRSADTTGDGTSPGSIRRWTLAIGAVRMGSEGGSVEHGSNTTRDFLGSFRRELFAFPRAAVAARKVTTQMTVCSKRKIMMASPQPDRQFLRREWRILHHGLISRMTYPLFKGALGSHPL